MGRARDNAATRHDHPDRSSDPPQQETKRAAAREGAGYARARTARGTSMERTRGTRLRRRPGAAILAAPEPSDEYDALLARARADMASALSKRRTLWDELLAIFRLRRPVDAELTEVSTLAEVAIDQVFAAHQLSAEQQEKRHGDVKDYAECAALYGYVLGYARAKREAA